MDRPATKIAVVGAGVIGLELGQALARLGVDVTVIGARGRVGPLTDPDIKAYAEKTFSNSFRFVVRAEVEAVARQGDGVQIRFRTGTGELVDDDYDYVLVTAGRKPNFDRLALENTSIALDALGNPIYDPLTLQAGTHPVFIAGDANGVLPVQHEASDEGRAAGTNAVARPAFAGPGQYRVRRSGRRR